MTEAAPEPEQKDVDIAGPTATNDAASLEPTGEEDGQEG